MIKINDMKLGKGIGILILLSSWNWAQAQNEKDALRYSYISPIGTARYTAIGGAFGALGADFTVLHTNPGGIGMYRKAEFTLTPSVVGVNTNSSFNGSSTDDSKLNFNFSNIGFVATKARETETTHGWLAGSFGIGYTRTNSFHERQLIEGVNTTSSLADIFVSQANGTNYQEVYDAHPFDAGLAWETFLIDTLPGSEDAYTSVINKYGQTQRLEKTTRGSMGEIALSFGGNYSNRLYVGASIGFPNIKYDEQSRYTEKDENDSLPNFKSFEYTQNLVTRGNGYNFKVGLIYRATDWVRFGAAVHTPTYFQMTDTWDSDMNASVYGTTHGASSPDGAFDYELVTPFRAIGSVGFIFGKIGLLSADYEHVNYSTARLRSSFYSFSAENNTVKNSFSSVGNLRIGTEWRYETFSFRGGCQLMGNPYKPGINTANPIYSGGIGFRDRGFSVDLAYMLRKTSGEVYLYDAAYVNAASVKSNESTVLVTFGFRY